MGNSNAPATAAEETATAHPPLVKKEQGNKIISGRYRLEDKMLGSGAFAVVKLGTDLVANKHVAIRIIDKEKLTPVSMQYLRREMEIYPTLSHPHVVQCYYCKEGKKYVVMVTELMPDGNLSTHLMNRAMVKEMEARDIFDQVLRAVEYLQTKNVAWRDLKCSNILLNLEKNLIKICDFGFADYCDKPFTDFPGTMAYSPPEVVSATPYLGIPRDVWSFGVLLYKLLGGSYPFGTKTNIATKERIVHGEPDVDSLFISDEGHDLIKQMLCKDPAKRIPLADIRKHPWMRQENVISRRRALSRADPAQLPARRPSPLASPGRRPSHPVNISPNNTRAIAASPGTGSGSVEMSSPPPLLANPLQRVSSSQASPRAKQVTRPTAPAGQDGQRKMDSLDTRAERAASMGIG